MALALNLTPLDVRMAYTEGFRCNQQDDVRQGDVLFGMVRVTLGAMSTLEDVDKLASCVERELVDRDCGRQDCSMINGDIGAGEESMETTSSFQEQKKSWKASASTNQGRKAEMWKVVGIGSCFSRFRTPGRC